ncbi:aldose epimerase family protein [Robiginitalea sp. IMCC43444]|uniref:aldose epimerase family protein n=1 Tax=Robiginitalea sp. IMCC43444 TaxID=3459121 RepID=UPI0040422FCF
MEQITIKNSHLELKALNYGAVIQALQFRAGNGNIQDLVVGLDQPLDYLEDRYSLGACIGRYAGRIGGETLQLSENSFPLNHTDGIVLHGGTKGLAKRYWTIESVKQDGEEPFIHFSYRSPHLEEGFPGNVSIHLWYILQKNSLLIRHKATSDQPTVLNLTNHTYFKIDDEAGIAHYEMCLNSRRRLETDEDLIPTGVILENTGIYDFSSRKTLGNIKLDTPFVLEEGVKQAAELFSGISGIRLRVYTNQPAVIVFTPETFAGICFETQNYPDAPNHPNFPSAILLPGNTYLNESLFTFDLP